MDKIENIEKKLFMYSLFDKEFNKFDMILTGFNDDDAAKYFINEFNSIYKVLNENFKDDVLDKKISSFLNRIHNTCIYRIAEFDFNNGCFINEKVQLVDLFDFKFNDLEVIDNNEK